MVLSVIIPVYNEESTIALVLRKLLALSFPFSVEIIVVDDGSTDRTKELIDGVNQDNVFKVHSSLINLGKGAAVRFGLEYASGDYVIIQDADLELNPEDIIKLVQPIAGGGVDVVYGSRFKSRTTRIASVPWYTILANKILSFYTNLLYGSKLTDMATSYKLARTDLIRSINLRCIGFEFDPEITAKLLRLGHRIVEVPISYEPRTTEEGKKITWWDGFRFMYYLTKFRFQKADSFVKKARKSGAAFPAST
ncbi:MAG: glycosyltransferase family 2 protein [Candidatus Krumholzibacteria bacterium]|nr:glycosyltransferase family 2 protein [Candidatus Krumholzibacteria bacterium]